MACPCIEGSRCAAPTIRGILSIPRGASPSRGVPGTSWQLGMSCALFSPRLTVVLTITLPEEDRGQDEVARVAVPAFVARAQAILERGGPAPFGPSHSRQGVSSFFAG